MKKNHKFLRTGSRPGFAAMCLTFIMSVGAVQAETVSYILEDVFLVDGSQMTGAFDWTYTVGDFGDGSGIFTALEIPWRPGGTAPPLEQAGMVFTIENNQIEISLDGNFHDYGLDISLKFVQPLSPTQSSLIDLTTSFYECCGNGFKDQPFRSGSIIPLVRGDVSGDGVVNAADLVIAERIIFAHITPTTVQTHALDVGPVVNGVSQPDGMLGAGDFLLLTRKALGLVSF
jgi:hypothetical protein